MGSVSMIYFLLNVLFSLAVFSSDDQSKMKNLFDFTAETEFTQADVDNWWEVSDTVR